MTIKLEEIMPDVARRVTVANTPEPTAEDRARDERRLQSFLAMGRADALAAIPPAYAGASLDAAWLVELVGGDSIARARDSLRERALAFIGPPGAGKSSLAAAMFRDLVESASKGEHLRWLRWTSSHKLAKARAGQPLGEGEAPAVDAALGARLLVLDELGGEDPRYASAVAEVLYERYERQLPTWVTTGVGAKEIAARYGGGIARRVFEGAVVFRLGARP